MVSQLTQRKLFGLKSKVRALYAMFGISVLITLLAGIILITFGLDWWLRGPWFFRLVVNVGALTALVYCFYRFLFYPLAVKMHLDDMALCVERGYPGLKDRLISSLQLARRYDPNDTFNSSAMVRALVSETEQVTRAMRFGAVARMHGRLVLFAVTALVGLGILIGGSILDSRLPGIWFNRIVLLSEGDPYPKKWELGVEEENLKELSSVPKGDSVRIVVRVTHVSEDKSRIYSGRPPRIEYYYTSEDRQHREKDLMEFEGEPNRYYIGLTSVTGNVRFIIKGPSGTEERDFIPVEGEVIVVPRPEIVAVMHQIKLPAYSRKTGFTSSDGGHMSAPRGSKIRVIVHSNRDVRKGKLVFVRSGDKSRGKGESEAEPDSIELTRPEEEQYANDLKVWVATFVAKESGSYRVVIYDKQYEGERFRNADPANYDVTVTSDALPEIEVSKPEAGGSNKVSEAIVRIKMRASDDRFVSLVVLIYRFQPADEGYRRPYRVVELYNMDKHRWLKKVDSVGPGADEDPFLQKECHIEYLWRPKNTHQEMEANDDLIYNFRVLDGFDLRDLPEGEDALETFGAALVNAERFGNSDTKRSMIMRWAVQNVIAQYPDTPGREPVYSPVLDESALAELKKLLQYNEFSDLERKKAVKPEKIGEAGELGRLGLPEPIKLKLQILALDSIWKPVSKEISESGSEDHPDRDLAEAAIMVRNALQTRVLELLLQELKEQYDFYTEGTLDYVAIAELESKIALVDWSLANFLNEPAETIESLEKRFDEKAWEYKSRVGTHIVGKKIDEIKAAVDGRLLEEANRYYDKAMSGDYAKWNAKLKELAAPVMEKRQEIRAALENPPPDRTPEQTRAFENLLTEYAKAIIEQAGEDEYRDRREYEDLQTVVNTFPPTDDYELFRLYAKLYAKGEEELGVMLLQLNHLYKAQKELAKENFADTWKDLGMFSSVDLFIYLNTLSEAIDNEESNAEAQENLIKVLEENISRIEKNIKEYEEQHPDIGPGTAEPENGNTDASEAPASLFLQPDLSEENGGEDGDVNGDGEEAQPEEESEDPYAIETDADYWKFKSDLKIYYATKERLLGSSERLNAFKVVDATLRELQKWIGPNFTHSGSEQRIHIVDKVDKLQSVLREVLSLIKDIRSLAFDLDQQSRRSLELYLRLDEIDASSETGEGLLIQLMTVFDTEAADLKKRFKPAGGAAVDKKAVEEELRIRMKRALDSAWMAMKSMHELMPRITADAADILEECEDNNNLHPKLQMALVEGTFDEETQNNIPPVIPLLKEVEKVYIPQLEEQINELRNKDSVDDIVSGIKDSALPLHTTLREKLFTAISALAPFPGDEEIIRMLRDIRKLQEIISDNLGVDTRPEGSRGTPDPETGEDPELKAAEERAEDLGINEQLRTKLKQMTTGGEYVEKLTAICDAAQTALDKNIDRESIEKIFSDAAVAEEWDFDTIVKKINELKPAP